MNFDGYYCDKHLNRYMLFCSSPMNNMNTRTSNLERLNTVLTQQKWCSTTTVMNLFKKNYGQGIYKLILEFTNLKKEIVTLQERNKFLTVCKNLYVIPSHIFGLFKNISQLKFKSNSGKSFLQKYLLKDKMKYLKLEIKDINIHLNYLYVKLKKQYDRLTVELDTQILEKFNEFYEIKLRFTRTFLKNKYENKLEIIQNKEKLTKENVEISDEIHEGWVKNLSSSIIPQEVMKVISLGNKFNFCDKPSINDHVKFIKSLQASIYCFPAEGDLIRKKVLSTYNTCIRQLNRQSQYDHSDV